MSNKCECSVCHCEFKPWEDEDGDIIDDMCQMCDLDYQIGAEADSEMGCSG